MKISKEDVKKDYGSILAFCDEEGIGIGVFNGLLKKTTNSFKRDKDGKISSSQKAFKRLRVLGYVKDEEVA